jgi:hypothetical protein
MVNPRPSQHLAVPVLHHVYRFRFTAGSTFVLTLQKLLGTLGGIVTVAATGTVTYFHNSVRLNSIEMWSCATINNATIVKWIPNSTVFSRGKTVEDVCVDTTVPAHIVTRPPASELYADWMTADTVASDTDICTISGNTNGFIDVNVTYQPFTDSANSTASFLALGVGPALGAIVYGNLDGVTGQVQPFVIG